MPDTGAPANIWYPDDTSPVAPLENIFLTIATSVNVAIAALDQLPKVADLAALASLGVKPIGDAVIVNEGGALFVSDGAVYIQKTVAHFTTSGVRDSAYAKASGAYLVKWASAITGVGSFIYDGTAWQPSGSPLTNLQLDTTNSVVSTITQIGIGKITGANATSVNEAVTFPVAFASVPIVQVTSIGGRTSGAFNTSGLITISGREVASLVGASTTGFTAYLQRSDSILTAGYDYYYAWSATGVPA